MFLKLGRIPLVVISSPEAAKHVLKTHDLDCCSRPILSGSAKLSYNGLDIAFAPYGEIWRQTRKLCVLELFSAKRVQSFQYIREEEVGSLLDSISASSETPVDLSEKICTFFASVIFRMSCGTAFRGSGLDTERLSEVIPEVESVLGNFCAGECIPYVGWIIDRLTGHHTKIEKVFRRLDSVFQWIIDDHINFQGSRRAKEDIIDVLLRLQREQVQIGETWLTKNHMKGVLFLAGTDTGAITVTWAMSELVRNPRVLKKAQDEIRNVAGKKARFVKEEEIGSLEYLRMVLKETLRLHPPGPLLVARETMSHFKINGFDIHPKTLIQINAWAIGRDPEYWNSPEEFIPERFANNASIDFKGQHFELLPFGAGRRVCPGIHLATTTMELLLANLLYCFDWKLPRGMKEEDMNMEEAAGQRLDVHKKIPLELVPVNYIM
ncbi:LOW QUALITY PROTEIN: cytochrome P450 71B2-like [Rutidosis leptorrhynchoides]|uniref:LOW QUALITY PROTEIN: cytochrome P450 71B2-like n=1 Tax=Rutidosis leptorrhynchoides TaxID=125765 RepID=UPI003A98DB29